MVCPSYRSDPSTCCNCGGVCTDSAVKLESIFEWSQGVPAFKPSVKFVFWACDMDCAVDFKNEPEGGSSCDDAVMAFLDFILQNGTCTTTIKN